MSRKGRRSHRNAKPPEGSSTNEDGLFEWTEWGGQRIWVVDYTPGGAPIGLIDDDEDDRVADCAPNDLEPF